VDEDEQRKGRKRWKSGGRERGERERGREERERERRQTEREKTARERVKREERRAAAYGDLLEQLGLLRLHGMEVLLLVQRQVKALHCIPTRRACVNSKRARWMREREREIDERERERDG
jgi:hypothetical protein